MASKKWLWGFGIAAVGYTLYRTMKLKQSVAFFQYSLSGLKFRISKSMQPEIIFSIQVYNPNKTSIPVTDFFGVIRKDGNILANFRNVSPITLGGQDTATIDISAKPAVLSIIMQIIQGKKLGTVTIEGLLKTDVFDMTINKEVTLSSLAGIGAINRMMRRERIRPVGRFPLHQVHQAKGFLQYHRQRRRPMMEPGTLV